MQSKFLHGEQLRAQIVSTLKGERRDLAVAFIGAGAIERAGLSNAEGTRIICDLWSGGCNPDAVRDLHEAGVQIRNLRDLHAKIYIGDSTAVVGSANLSSNGFGDVGTPQQWGLEAGVLVDQPGDLSEIVDWFENQFASAIDFDPNDPQLDEAWERRLAPTRSSTDLSEDIGLLRKAILQPDLFDGIGFVFTDTANDREALNDAIKAQSAQEPKRKDEIERWRHNAFTEWPTENVKSWPGEFIAYHLGSRGGFTVTALRLEARNADKGYVLASRDWKGIAGRVVPGLSQLDAQEDADIAREIMNVCDSEDLDDFYPSFRTAKELSSWYQNHVNSGLLYVGPS